MMLYKKSKVYLALLATYTASISAQTQQDVGAMLEEIIVTAEKREATLQDTAIAVTALDAGTLERSNIEDSLDLQFAVPNLMLGQNDNITLRGVGQSVLGGGADPAVSSTFNTMAISPTGEIYDLERIEVLRGPQGTLFGRNTTGGVINTVSAKPTETFSADLAAQVANFGSIRTVGVVNLPLTDSVYQRFAFNTVRRDGYTENEFNGTDVDGRDQVSIRSTTRFEFGGDNEATLIVQYYDEDSDRQSAVKVACKQDTTLGCAPDTEDEIGYPADFIGSVDTGLLLGGILKPNRYGEAPSDYRTVRLETDPTYELEELFAGLEVNISLGDNLTLTSVTSYADGEFNQFRDFDLAAAPDAFNVTPATPEAALTYLYDGEFQTRTDYASTQRNISESESFAQEFRLASGFDGPLNFLVGISYFEEDVDFWGASYIPGLHNTLNPAFAAGLITGGVTNESDRTSESQAVFGEVNYDLTENLILTTGLRYTEDEKRSTAGFNTLGEVTNFVTAEGSWEEVTGKINLSWRTELPFTNDTTVYGTLSRGYKGGGLNPGNIISETFDPEYINAIEIGAKNQLLNNSMQLNAAAFYYDYKDYQVGGLIEGVAVNFNAEKAKIQGFELEGLYLITENLLVNANLAILDTEIVSSLPLPNTSLGSVGGVPILEDVEGNDLPNAPESSFSLGVQYTQQLNDTYELRYRADYYWQDEFQGREFDNYTYDAWDRTDLYLTLSETGGRWEVEAFVKNVTDDDGITGGSAEAALVGLFRKLRLLDPRTYGVEFNYHWD
ncbi:TonB-dependent receptor [Exilibacterium tricleocarpae]|uniref:TonB-dependent receptor n=1 Tax=Exilibacterium tricleocarpae TaxID=2591008 RepID=A0A545TNH3_9GAMM|nr:TonB-dependent receptor [Exilibacterium tricleocarpae]TQV78772.1 TonB-dependent receptor [Exilibacterium tricleocarpae]